MCFFCKSDDVSRETSRKCAARRRKLEKSTRHALTCRFSSIISCITRDVNEKSVNIQLFCKYFGSFALFHVKQCSAPIPLDSGLHKTSVSRETIPMPVLPSSGLHKNERFTGSKRFFVVENSALHGKTIVSRETMYKSPSQMAPWWEKRMFHVKHRLAMPTIGIYKKKRLCFT